MLVDVFSRAVKSVDDANIDHRLSAMRIIFRITARK